MSYRLGLLHGALLVGLLLAIFVVSHAEDWLVVSGLAKHLDGQQHCNSTTSGLGWERSQNGADRYQIGFYRNSNCKWSAYVAKAWLPLQAANLRMGVVAGGATGYGRPFTPAAGLAFTYEHKGWGLDLTYIPPLRGSADVLWLQAKVKW